MEGLSESINFYTYDRDNCLILKILMDPFEYLEWFNKTYNIGNSKNKNLCKFMQSVGSDDDFFTTLNARIDYENTKKFNFIKSQSEFNIRIQDIQNILIQAYINYYDTNKKLSTKLYRSISRNELEFLKKSRNINTLWSTSNSLDTVLGFTIETAEAEWNPKEHFILEFSVRGKIPFIDVDKDSTFRFEPNEIILVPPFTISGLKLVKDGGMDQFGFYTDDNIPIYSVSFKNKDIIEQNVSYEEVMRKYYEVSSEIENYGNMIEMYLNKEINNSIFHQSDYRMWAKKLQELIILQQQYISYSIRNGLEVRKIDGEPCKIKVFR